MGTQAITGISEILIPAAAPGRQSMQPKKRLVRRTERDYSQSLRRGFQTAFLILNIYLGGLFYFWARSMETGHPSAIVSRPPGVEGWLPIAGLMNFRYWLATGHVPAVHPAAMFLLVTFLSVSFLFRKAFCSWLCPIGTLSEYLWHTGRKLFRRNFNLPRWVDVPLRGLKYLLLGFFVWAISSMSSDALAEFMRSPYGLIADVKMLNFFRELGETGAIVLSVLVVSSLFVKNFWCRYLCPYGALLGLVARFSPLRIRRDGGKCIDCAKCAAACPSRLPVDKLFSVRSPECTGCLECVAVCPAKDALWAGLPELGGSSSRQRPRLPAWAMAAGIAVLFFGIVGYAKAAGFWKSDIPQRVYLELVPHADQASHPMPRMDSAGN